MANWFKPNQQRYYFKRKAEAAAKGLCLRCFTKPVHPGLQSCDACRERTRKVRCWKRVEVKTVDVEMDYELML